MTEPTALETLANHADRLSKDGKYRQAFEAYGEVIDLCANRDSPFENEMAAWAGNQQAKTMRDHLEGESAALVIYELVADLYADDTHQSVCKQVAVALAGRASIVGRTREPDAALRAYEDVLVAARRGSPNRPASWGLQCWATKAKGRLLARMSRYDESIAALDDLTVRLARCDDARADKWRQGAQLHASAVRTLARAHPFGPAVRFIVPRTA